MPVQSGKTGNNPVIVEIAPLKYGGLLMPDFSALIRIRSLFFPQVHSVKLMLSRPVLRLLPISTRFRSTALSTGHFRLSATLKLMTENIFALLGSEESRFVSGLGAPAVRLASPRPAELFWSELTV